jgi:hypothetical protein
VSILRTVVLLLSGSAVFLACAGDSGLETDRDVDPLVADTSEDVESDTGETGSFTGCNPFSAEECDEGEKCSVSPTGGLVCVPAGDLEVGEPCRMAATSQCGVGLVCVSPLERESCCSPLCQTSQDCETGICEEIAVIGGSSIGFCSGICPEIAAN